MIPGSIERCRGRVFPLDASEKHCEQAFPETVQVEVNQGDIQRMVANHQPQQRQTSGVREEPSLLTKCIGRHRKRQKISHKIGEVVHLES